MSETQSLLRVRKTDYVCDHCSEGILVFTGASWEIKGPATHPVGTKIFAHRCDVCGMQVNHLRIYPHLEYIQETSQ